MSTQSNDSSSQRQLDRELKDMITHLSSRLGQLQQSRDSDDHLEEQEEDDGVRIITLAGTNTGATLKSDLSSDPSRSHHHQNHQGVKNASEGDEDEAEDDQEDMGTLVNSNFQAVNNSIMLSGSFSSNDPGVTVEISSGIDHHPHHRRQRRHGHTNKLQETEN